MKSGLRVGSICFTPGPIRDMVWTTWSIYIRHISATAEKALVSIVIIPVSKYERWYWREGSVVSQPRWHVSFHASVCFTSRDEPFAADYQPGDPPRQMVKKGSLGTGLDAHLCS